MFQRNVWPSSSGSKNPQARDQHEQVAAVDFYTLKMEALCSPETSIYTISTQCHIPEGSIFHNHCHEKLKFYILTEVLYGLIQPLQANLEILF
jgi:hypothetical protein